MAHPAARLSWALIALTLALPVFAQRSIEVTGDRLSGFVLPVEPVAGDITLESLRAWTWTVDDTNRLVMEQDVRIVIGRHQFESSRAVVWMNRIPSAGGEINQLAIYFEEVRDGARQAGMGIGGSGLLVTASARGEVKLRTALLTDRAAPRNSFLREAEDRLSLHLRGLLAAPPSLANRPQVEGPPVEDEEFIPVPGGVVEIKEPRLPKRVTLPDTESQVPWLVDREGIIRFSADSIEISSGEEENTVVVIGGLVIEFISQRGADPVAHITLTAERAVMFTDPGPLDALSGQFDAESIRGMYLEGNVTATADGGEYWIRSPAVYYDLRRQQAMMSDAMLRAYPQGGRVPVIVRADEMRQVAENQWQATGVRVSTSEFFVPHLAIGAERTTVTQRPVSDTSDETETHIDSRNNTMRVSGLPVMYWPRFSGTAQDIPLKQIETGTRRNDGLRVLTTWDLFSLTGMEAPPGVDADLKIDAFTDRGAATGIDLIYDVGDSYGSVDLYGLYDHGTDRTSSGRNVMPDDEFRGVALLEHTTQFSPDWTLQAQGSLISDETFITAWREDEFTDRREYETSLYLKHQRDNAAFTALAKYSLQDFLSNDYLLASRQYSVDKVPEFTYRRYGDSLSDDRFTYSMENRATRMMLVLQRRTPGQIGVRGRAFGLDEDDEIADALRATGLHSNYVQRFDSRHELAMPTEWSIFKVVPFVVGRFTAYDDDFKSFSSDSDSMRTFLAGGVRFSTQFQRVNNSVENRLLDLHRMRHIVEPYGVLWYGDASVDQRHLPVFDEAVESLADGSAVELGVRNTWQTQRGGPGRWRSVDVFALDTSIVIDSESTPNESPTPQFFEYRPEYSQFGSHVRGSGTWLVSDSLSLVGEGTYVLDTSIMARTSVGAELRHSPLLRTYVEYRSIDVSDSQLLDVGWVYQLTPTYEVSLSPQYDFRVEELRSLNARVTRTFPDFDLTVQVRHDRIRKDTSLGASMRVAEF